MRAAGVTVVLALARANISPWQVLWWLLVAAVVVAGVVYVAQYTVKWLRGDEPTGMRHALSLVGAGCGLLVWGEAAGWATLL